eukprot:1137844-Pelagomonas_calceolata.AAC.3
MTAHQFRHHAQPLACRPGPVAETPGPLWLTMSSVRDPSAVAAKASDAAARAAAMNADASNAQSYAHAGQQDVGEAVLLAKATMASISALPEVRMRVTRDACTRACLRLYACRQTLIKERACSVYRAMHLHVMGKFCALINVRRVRTILKCPGGAACASRWIG